MIGFSKEAKIGLTIGLAAAVLSSCMPATTPTILETGPTPAPTETPLLPSMMEPRELAPGNIEAFRQKLQELLPEKAIINYHVINPTRPGFWGVQHWLRINEDVQINYNEHLLNYYYSITDQRTFNIARWLEGAVKKYGCPLTIEQLEKYKSDPQSAEVLPSLIGVEYPGMSKKSLNVAHAVGITIGRVDGRKDNPRLISTSPTVVSSSYPDCSGGDSAPNNTNSNRPIVVNVP